MHKPLASQKLTLSDLNATTALALSLASSLTPGLTMFLNGQLGAGKTTLVRAMLAALGHTGVTKSPTYTLVETYHVAKLNIHHFDLYRLADPAELEFIGIRDYITPVTICIFEWPEKGQGYLPTPDLEINLVLDHAQRLATINAYSEQGHQVLTAITHNK